MLVLKCVAQGWGPPQEILDALEAFRQMINECIAIGTRENVTSMRSLGSRAYHRLSRYDVPACYRLTAISKAAGILRNHRKSLRKNPNSKLPHAKKPCPVDCYAFRVLGNQLRLTVRPHQFVFVVLNSHTLKMIAGMSLRSVTLTPTRLSISYAKLAEPIEPEGLIGIDSNLDNVTIASSNGKVQAFDLSQATQIKSTYRMVTAHLYRIDQRIRRRLLQKYGALQRNRVGWILNNVSSSIVKMAKARKFGIVMENLKGIRRLYGRSSGNGMTLRWRMNSWSFHELQRQIEYKARWEGIPVTYIASWGTTSKCSICGKRTIPNEHRTLYCPQCQTRVDRDVNAARNILAKGALRFSANGFANETTNRNNDEPSFRVDANQLASAGTRDVDGT